MKRIIPIILAALLMATSAFATVSNTNNKDVFAGDGSNKAWEYDFPIILTSDLTIYTVDSTGNITPITSNYSINTSTSTVTYPVTGSALPVGSQIILLRSVPLTQTTSLKNQYRLPLDVIETSLDKQTMMVQQVQEQINRAILAPLNQTFASGGLTFPQPSANAVIGWDATGTILTNYLFQGLLTSSTPTFAGLTLSGNSLTIGNLGGILKAVGGSVGTATADSDYSTPGGSEVFTHKTYDTAGTGNVFKINGTTFSGSTIGSGSNIVLGNTVSGNSGVIAQSSGTLTANHCAKFDASGNLVDNGSGCSGGSGMVYPASAGIAVTDTSSWLGSYSTSGGLPGSTINWTSINQIKSSNINWSDINGVSTISGGINWTGIQNIIKSQNINWNDVNGIAKENSGAINWIDISRVGPISHTGINWTDFTASGIMKFNGSSAPAAATSGTDYAPATSGNAILYGNNLGGFSNVTIGTGISFSGGTLSNSSVNNHGVTAYNVAGTYTWTAPTGVNWIDITLIGGGQGSGWDSTGSSGVGAGATLEAIYKVVPGNNYTLVVGAGGAALPNGSGSFVTGNSGAASTFDGTLTANGNTTAGVWNCTTTTCTGATTQSALVLNNTGSTSGSGQTYFYLQNVAGGKGGGFQKGGGASLLGKGGDYNTNNATCGGGAGGFTGSGSSFPGADGCAIIRY